MRTNLIVLSILFSSFLSFAQTGNTQDKLSEVRNYLEKIDSKDNPGISVSIVFDGNVIFSSAYGMSDLENSVPLKPSSLFDLASVAKPFTGIAISMLEEKGLITREDDIRVYLPELPEFGYKITVGHLLHHCSGLRDWVPALTVAGRTEDDVITAFHIWNLIKNMKELNFVPGDRFNYSNTNYFLLAVIIEKITGETFPNWMHDNIFDPIGMDNTFVVADYNEIIKNRAQSYNKIDNKYVNFSSQLLALGSPIYSSTEDLSKWLIDLQNHKVIKESVYSRLTNCATFNNGEEGFYGYGFEHRSFYGNEYITHGGWWQGYRSKFVSFPKEKLSIVVLSNSLNIRPTRIVTDLIKIMLDIKVTPNSHKEDLKIPQRIHMDSIQYDSFVGKYVLNEDTRYPIVYNVWRDEHKYYMQQYGYPLNEAFAISDTSFFVVPEHEYIIFKKRDLKVQGLTIKKQNNHESEWTKVDYVSLRDNYKEFCGTYYSDELKTEYTISYINEKLVVTHFHNEDVELIQELTDLFVSNKWWFERLEFVRDENKKIIGFRLDCDHERVKKLLFKKKLNNNNYL